MNGHAEVMFCLPSAAAGELKELARQQNSTIDGYVGAWLRSGLNNERVTCLTGF